MKRTVKFLALLLAALILGTALISCTGNGETTVDDETTAAEETLPPEREAPVIIEDGKSAYIMYRSSFASAAVTNAATALYRKIKNGTGAQITYTEDLASMNNTVNDNYEILIGDTNRPESAAKKAELTAMDWFVGIVGKKIVVIGGCEESTLKAITAFENMVVAGLSGFASNGQKLVIDMLKTDKLYTYNYPAKDFDLCGHKLSEYAIRYSSEESSKSAAALLSETIMKKTGIVLESANAMSSNEVPLEIVIGKTGRGKSAEITDGLEGIMPYAIVNDGGKIYICGKGLGLEGGINVFISDYISKSEPVAASLSIKGDAAGSTVFNITSGADIRVMSNNVWKCDQNQPAWVEMGMDCSAKSRSVGFSYVYIAFKPDIIDFQEMSTTMLGYIKKELAAAGLNYGAICFAPSQPDDTPILYNADRLKLLDSGHHVYTYGNNGNTKSYTWGYFEDLVTGKKFINLSTHFWYKSDTDQPGSTELRRQQAAEVVALSEQLIKKYNCPMIIAGDLNTNVTTVAYKELLNGSFEDCHDIAAEKTNNRGHHSCSASGFNTVLADGDYSKAIDHILVKNKGDMKVLKFYQAVLDFYWPLSDHMPVFIDIAY